MAGLLALAFLVVSALLLAGAVALVVALRRGEGPTYGANREYDASRREAVRALTGREVAFVSGEQWYDRRRKRRLPDEGLTDRYRSLAAEALAVAVPASRDLSIDGAVAHLAAERAWVVPAVSTAEFRAADIDRWEARGRLVIGLVLFNPEPPGGSTTRVTLPVQVLFDDLRAAGRDDLVAAFEALAADRD